ncbi:MAG: hypothetical protein K6E98_06890 [Lachnospiraceae bacterium]|nr:hypothetical protein [Lachnospiraceae bacterium]
MSGLNINNKYGNSVYTQSFFGVRKTVDDGIKSDVMVNKNSNSGWNIGSAKVDVNSSDSVRKQMQDQLRNLFEKENSKNGNMGLIGCPENKTDAVDSEDDNSEDKLLNSGKIYNFKEISNRIMRAKNPISAGQALIAAKRKISEIKRKLANGNGDSDELQMALVHAKKMETVAKRKKNNLEMEEWVQNTEKRDEMFDKEKKASSLSIDEYERIKDEILDKQMKLIDDNSAKLREEFEKKQIELEKDIEDTKEETELLTEKMQEQMEGFLDEMDDSQSEMLRELSEVIDSMEIIDPHMSEQELNKLKLKHRLSENKAMMKADMDYLKGTFEGMDAKGSAFSTFGGINASMTSAALDTSFSDSSNQAGDSVNISV